MNKKITNTSVDEVRPEWVGGGNPDAIVDQEKRGQDELVNSEQLPCDCSEADKKTLEAHGVVFGKPSASDPLFCDATLPSGWKKEASDNDMWSYLVDNKGKRIASIFYKAAYYDRSAYMSVD